MSKENLFQVKKDIPKEEFKKWFKLIYSEKELQELLKKYSARVMLAAHAVYLNTLHMQGNQRIRLTFDNIQEITGLEENEIASFLELFKDIKILRDKSGDE